MRTGVISDTHIPARARRLPREVFELFEGVEAVLHAGDFISEEVLHELAAIAPVHGVAGNMDGWELARILPERRRVEIGGVTIGMVHDSGPAAGRRVRMRTEFTGCRVVVFGHSHQPVADDDGTLLLLNPGSACDPRFGREPTVALLDVEEGRVRAELVVLGAAGR